MKYFWFLIYNLFFLPLFWLYIHISAIFSEKIRTGLNSRKHLFKELNSDLGQLDSNRKNILIQCSSLGEFHEAKPVITQLDKSGSYNFIISFFSPSGYDNFDPHGNDLPIKSKVIKTFLPLDSYRNVARFMRIINPDRVLLIKYDLWYNMLYYLKRHRIYSVLINAKYRKDDKKWSIVSRSFYRTMYNCLRALITADSNAEKFYKAFLSDETTVMNYGDTKIEYITGAAENDKSKTNIDRQILWNRSVFLAGSTLKEDDDLILPVIDKICEKHSGNGLALLNIIAPHEPSEVNLRIIEKKIESGYPSIRSIRYSRLQNLTNENVILIDRIGLLFSLYRYADVAYVGGGLRTGMHNVLEPASYGIPVIFGNVRISDDAAELLRRGSGKAIGNIDELYETLLELLKEKDKGKSVGLKSNGVFRNKTEASKKIAELLTEI